MEERNWIRDLGVRKCRCKFYHNYYTIMMFCISLLRCQAQSNFYDLSNLNYWDRAGVSSNGEIGTGYGRISESNNLFTSQDFGGSNSDGFDQEEYQKHLQVNGIRTNLPTTPHLPISFLPNFYAYGSNNNNNNENTFPDVVGTGYGDLAIDDGQPEADGAITRFPTLIPPEKLAGAIGFTDPAIDVVDVTESTQPHWEFDNHGEGNIKQTEEIKDVSMMKSVPVPIGKFNSQYGSSQQQQTFENTNWMRNGNNNNCFSSSQSLACSPNDASGGDSYLSADGTYQFPMPDEKAQTGINGVGNMANDRFLPSEQMIMGYGGGDGGSIFSLGNGNPAFGTNGQQQSASMGISAIGAKSSGPDELGDDDDEEEEGTDIGEFVENGPVNTFMNNVRGPIGGLNQQKNDGLQRYAEYLQTINQKYGIGMPGINNNGPDVVATVFGSGQMVNQNYLQKSIQQQQLGGNVGFGQQIQQWNTILSNGGSQHAIKNINNGQMQIVPLNGRMNIGDGRPSKQQIQNFCKQQQQYISRTQLNNHQDSKMPLECSVLFRNNNNDNNIVGNSHNKETTNLAHEYEAEQHFNLQNHKPQHGTIVGFVRSNGNNSNIETYQQKHGNRINPDLGVLNNAVGTGRSANGNGHYGSGILSGDRMVVDHGDDELSDNNFSVIMSNNKNSNSLHQSNAAFGSLSTKADSTSDQYPLNGAKIPYPFGTALQPTAPKILIEKGVDGGEWLSPAPSVSSLLGQKPIISNERSNGSNSKPSFPTYVPFEQHQQQQQRSIDAATALLQQQLLLALLSTSTTISTTTPMPTITSTTTSTTTTMVLETTTTTTMPQQIQLPLQQNTTSLQALTQQIRRLPAVLYADSRYPNSRKLETMLREVYGLPLVTFYADRMDGGNAEVEKNLELLTAHSGLPYLFICGTFIGSNEHIQKYHYQHQVPRLVEYVCNSDTSTLSHSNKGQSKKKRKNNSSSLMEAINRRQHHIHLMMMDEGTAPKERKHAGKKSSQSRAEIKGNHRREQRYKWMDSTNNGTTSKQKASKAMIGNLLLGKQRANKMTPIPSSSKFFRDAPSHSLHHSSLSPAISSAKKKSSMAVNGFNNADIVGKTSDENQKTGNKIVQKQHGHGTVSMVATPNANAPKMEKKIMIRSQNKQIEKIIEVTKNNQ